MPAVKVSTVLADHARARAAGERAAAGRRPVNRSRAARQLAQRLTAAAGVPVEIRWDSSGASSGRGRSWAYHVDWSDGPTRTGMRNLVDELVDQADSVAGLDPSELDVDHPERGTAEALQLAARLGRLSGGNTDRMAELLDAHGLAALTGQLDPDPDSTVVPFDRARTR